ncbi:hypothetical protein PHBOTO_002474 [Pseudozyma hubeiensis]|nr:hypothetical protein PHBOTO_002474 [Pseudozyma hubeiensis]
MVVHAGLMIADRVGLTAIAHSMRNIRCKSLLSGTETTSGSADSIARVARARHPFAINAFNPRLLPFLLTSSALAGRVVDKRGHRHHLSRRDGSADDGRADCTQKMVSDFWSNGKPPGATAVVCYKHGYRYRVSDFSEQHYKFFASRTCQSYADLFGPNNIPYDCFYLIGANTFEPRDDAGFDNLAIMKDDSKCTWANRKLTCSA